MNKSNMAQLEIVKKRLRQLRNYHFETGEGRTIDELLKTQEVLRGHESIRLRQFCTMDNCMEPSRDLDRLGRNLYAGNTDGVFMDYTIRLSEHTKKIGMELAVGVVAQEYAALRWGPTQVPIFNLLGLFMQIVPSRRAAYLEFAKFFIEAKVPVDSKDLSGTTALSHSFSTKPGFDLEYAQILYDAGGDVNGRNRYGETIAGEILRVHDRDDPEAVQKATNALEWFLSHGGNLDIADGDGFSPRLACEGLCFLVPALKCLADEEDERRRLKGDSCCALCGRDEGKLLSCSRCKKAKYCSPESRACQKLDWPKHKTTCKA